MKLMRNRDIHAWVEKILTDQGYSLQGPPETMVETPWSTTIRLSAAEANFYLKQTPADLFIEANIIRFLRQLYAEVAEIITVNEPLHCFLMQDAGSPAAALSENHIRGSLILRSHLTLYVHGSTRL